MKLLRIAALFICLLVVLIMLGACASQPQIVTKTIPVAVPIIYSPAPPVVARPVLPTDSITATTPAGEVAKDYAADVQALLGYSQELEDIIAQYEDINEAYAGLKDKAESDWKAKTGQDLVVQQPTATIKPISPTPTK